MNAITFLVDMLMGKLKTVLESILFVFNELPTLFAGTLCLFSLEFTICGFTSPSDRSFFSATVSII